LALSRASPGELYKPGEYCYNPSIEVTNVIDRYEAAEIARIWSEENKYRKWLDVELAVTETWAEMGRCRRSA